MKGSYVKVWATLVVITLAEVGLAWIHLPVLAMLAALLGLSLAKAALIAWWFMHLKSYRPKPLLAIFPMLFLCIALLLTILPDGLRAFYLRPQ